MHKGQFEFLLNQLYECLVDICKEIEIGCEFKIDELINKKRTILRALEKSKKILETDEITLFDVLLSQIIEQDASNLELLRNKKSKFYSKYRLSTKTSKLLNKYQNI